MRHWLHRIAPLDPGPGLFAAVLTILCLAATSLAAQWSAPAGEAVERQSCAGLVAARRPAVIPAAWRAAALAADEARLTYVGHATFLIESARGVRIATDYNDYVKPRVLPDVVTMNRAHSTHYTLHPEPGIRHVLRGWGEGDSPARHDLTVRDVQIRNVPTNIRDYAGGTRRHGSSIFIFEVGTLCIAHLGHLHHTLTAQQLAEIGPIDVVLFPVDGGVTLDQDGMLEVLAALKAQVMIPMHAFSAASLERFVESGRTAYGWTVRREAAPSLVLSKAALPERPAVVVLPGR